MKFSLPIFLVSLFITQRVYSQCTPAAPTENTSTVDCSSCNNTIASGTVASVTVGTTGNTWCVPSGQSTTITQLNLNNGILRNCGTLVITDIAFGGSPPNSGNPAFIYNGSGATLTISSAETSIPQYVGIANRGGTINFSQNINLGNTSTWIINASASSTMNFNGTFQVNGTDNFVNRGKATFNGTVTINTNSGMCLEKSFTEFKSTFTNSGSMYYNGTTATDAIINYYSTIAFNTTLVSNSATNSNIKYCKASTGTAYAANFCTANGGSGGACPLGFGTGGYASYNGSGDCASPLPVVFSKLLATPQDNGSLISWTTLMEQNVKQFEVLRSYNGVDFDHVQYVKAIGNSVNQQSYYIFDDVISAGQTIYYKIKSEENDGKIEYSPVFYENSSTTDFALDAFPSPFTNCELFIRSHDDDNELMLELYDLAGKEITKHEIYEVKAGNVYNIAPMIYDLPKGEYILKTISDHSVNYTKLVVK